MESPAGRIMGFFKSPRGIRVLMAAGIAGILLILLSELLPRGEDPGDPPGDPVAEYTLLLEQRLQEIVGSIQGTGRCRVMLTLENGVKYVYADSGGSSLTARQETGLVVTELQPTIKGVVVVCEGGQDETVQRRVTEAVTAVLNITAKRVCVVAGNGE